MSITASMVKELREQTGAGMMECKKALVEANGDMAAAEEILAKYGLKKAAKSAERAAVEGQIVVLTQANFGIILEMNSETDFVSRHEEFSAFIKAVAQVALNNPGIELDALLEQPFAGKAIKDACQDLTIKFGEKIHIRRLGELQADDDAQLGAYTHQGRIGALVVVKGGKPELARDLAMHIAAMNPQYITVQEVDPSRIAHKQELLRDQENMTEAQVAEQLQQYLNEICLLTQPFFKNPEQNVATILKAANAQVLAMLRFEVGEGMEVVKKNFEAEVAAVRNQA